MLSRGGPPCATSATRRPTTSSRCTSGTRKSAPMDARSAARRWSSTWERAWRDHDPADVASLYADDAVLRPHAPQRPAGYIQPALAAEHSTECAFDEPLVDGDRAAVAWHAAPRLTAGGSIVFEGVSLLRFNTDGLVVEQRDFWGSAP